MGVLVGERVLEGVPEELGETVGEMVALGDGVRVEEKLFVGVALGVLLAEGSYMQEVCTEPDTAPPPPLPAAAERCVERLPDTGCAA